MHAVPLRHRAPAFFAALALAAGMAALVASGAVAADMHRTNTFSGTKVNAGTVVHSNQDGKMVLTLSDDFVAPDTPDPHWQVIDSRGTVYLLQRLAIKGDKMNRSIVLPDYVKDVAKVQIWCAFAETVLGEASFASPVK
jgi:hypothetical protein